MDDGCTWVGSIIKSPSIPRIPGAIPCRNSHLTGAWSPCLGVPMDGGCAWVGMMRKPPSIPRIHGAISFRKSHVEIPCFLCLGVPMDDGCAWGSKVFTEVCPAIKTCRCN